MPDHVRSSLAVVLVSLAVLVALCASGCQQSDGESQSSTQTGTTDAASREPTTVPDFRGMTLGEAADLVRESDVFVYVTFPVTSVTVSFDATRIAGALKPARSEKRVVPKRTLLLNDMILPPGASHTFEHRILSQEPTSGTPIGEAPVIRLNAGLHPGAAARSWLENHPERVRRRGAEVCFTCHDETDCSDCHVEWLSAD